MILLLTVNWAGRTWRISTEDCEVVSRNGEDFLFHSGLDLLEIELSLEDSGPRSLPLQIYLDGVAGLVNSGHRLDLAEGELSLIRAGGYWEDRQILLAGRLVDPEYGEDTDPVRASLQEEAWDDTNTVLVGTAAVVAGVTWDSPADRDEGYPYPLVFGVPGGGTIPATPARYIDETNPDHHLLICDGHSVATTVQIYNQDLTEFVTKTPTKTQDELGRACTTVDITTEAGRVTDPWEPTHRYFCSWTQAGIKSVNAARGVTGAGDLLWLLLERSSLRLDRGRIASAATWLNRFEVGGYIDDPETSPWDWIRDNLLPLIPARLAAGPLGFYPAISRWDAVEGDKVELLVEGQNCLRQGLVRYEGAGEIANEITLKFGWNSATGAYTTSRTLTGSSSPVAGQFGSMLARDSRSRWGERRLVIETEIVYSTAGADLILLHLLAGRAHPRRGVRYLTQTSESLHLREGDVVGVTDSGLALSAHLGFIQRLRRSIGESEISVVLLDRRV